MNNSILDKVDQLVIDRLKDSVDTLDICINQQQESLQNMLTEILDASTYPIQEIIQKRIRNCLQDIADCEKTKNAIVQVIEYFGGEI